MQIYSPSVLTRQPTFHPTQAPQTPARAPTSPAGPAQGPAENRLIPKAEDFSSQRAYTDFLIRQAQESQRLADQLKKDFGNKKPEDDRVAYTAYVAQDTAAKHDRARAEQAMAAELRETYKGDPANKDDTTRAARRLAYDYHDQPDIQVLSADALKTVLNESPMERETNVKLYDLNKAGDKLDAWTARLHAKDGVTEQEVVGLHKEYYAKQADLLSALEKELDKGVEELPSIVKMKEVDLYDAASRSILSRYQDDPEFETVLKAAVIVKNVNLAEAQGPEGQMKRLAELMPGGLDPSVKRVVMADQRMKGVEDRFVDWAADSVTAEYDKGARYYDGLDDTSSDYQRKLMDGMPPALGATNRLRELTDYRANPHVSDDLAARIVNRLRTEKDADGTTTMHKIMEDVGLDGKHYDALLKKDNPSNSSQSEYPSYEKVLRNLADTAESVGRDMDPRNRQWASPETQKAVEGLGHDLALRGPTTPHPRPGGMNPVHPAASRFDPVFEKIAAEGDVTLALEVARQLKAGVGVPPGNGSYRAEDYANSVLKHVQGGIKQFKTNTDELYAEALRGMAPVAAPAARMGIAMTEEDVYAGIQNIAKSADGKAVVEQMQKDRDRFNLRGYELLRLGETVTFYEGSLSGLDEYKGVSDARTSLLDTKASKEITQLSTDAKFLTSARAIRMALQDEWKQGSLTPQYYGVVAQFMGDMPEFLLETYMLKNKGAGEPRFTNIAGVPDVTEQMVKATRVGHMPWKAGVMWGGGGAFQAALTAYLYENVHFDKSEEYRKPLLLGLVGGFALFHLGEAAMAFGRKAYFRGHTDINAMKAAYGNNIPWYLRAMTPERMEQWTRLVVDATKGLTGTLAGLMFIATVWDATGVYHRWGDPIKAGTHAVNLFNDLLLLRLQVREFTKRIVADPKARGPFIKAMAEGLFHEESALLKKLPPDLAKKLGGKHSLDIFEALVRKWAKGPTKFLANNPIGWTVNILYAATSVVNFVTDMNRNQDKLEKFDKLFLEGTGIGSPQADVLKRHAWWGGAGKGDGFFTGYAAMDGDPEQFVEYVNGFKDTRRLQTVSNWAEGLPEHVDGNGDLPLTQENQAYLSLPIDPAKTDLSKFSVITYNGATKRYEDPVTRMYYDGGLWRFDPKIGNTFGWQKDTQDMKPVFYDPVQGRLMLQSVTGNAFEVQVRPQSTTGMRDWMLANQMPMPKKAGDPVAEPPAELPPMPEQEELNTYVVRLNDSVWRVAGNDPKVVEQIYDLNLWLGPGARDRDLLNPGEVLVLPPGYTPPRTKVSIAGRPVG
nr:hypothetical protein [uncultured Caldimonas sp.]